MNGNRAKAVFGSREFQRIFKGIGIHVVLATADVFGTKDSLIPFQGKIPIPVHFGGNLKSTSTSWFLFLCQVRGKLIHLRHIVRHLWE
jgi:hypothetical protein